MDYNTNKYERDNANRAERSATAGARTRMVQQVQGRGHQGSGDTSRERPQAYLSTDSLFYAADRALASVDTSLFIKYTHHVAYF